MFLFVQLYNLDLYGQHFGEIIVADQNPSVSQIRHKMSTEPIILYKCEG